MHPAVATARRLSHVAMSISVRVDRDATTSRSLLPCDTMTTPRSLQDVRSRAFAIANVPATAAIRSIWAAILIVGCGGNKNGQDAQTPRDAGDMDAPANPLGGGSLIDAMPQGGTTMCGGVTVDTKTNAHNCGECAHSCQGQACTEGYCGAVTLSTGTAQTNCPETPHLDSSFVYWYDELSKYIARAPISGGGSSVVFPFNDVILSFATDGTNVYFEDNHGLLGDYSLLRVPVGGGSSSTISDNHTQGDHVLTD